MTAQPAAASRRNDQDSPAGSEHFGPSSSSSSHRVVTPLSATTDHVGSRHHLHHVQQIHSLSKLLDARILDQSQALVYSPSGVSQVRSAIQQPLVVAPQELEEISKMAAEEVEGRVSREVFTSYTAKHSVFSSAKPHPADIVEACSRIHEGMTQVSPLSLNGEGDNLWLMNNVILWFYDVPLPMPTYELAQCVLQCEKLSSLQLEGVLYACQRHRTILPNGRRGAFFMGDGAGVGKGRQIAAIVLENYVRGRCRHIWFSVSHDLKMDAERDLRDIGCYIKVIDGCQQLDKETRILGLPADFKAGVLFSTYAALVSTIHRGSQSRSRLQQLVSWCGGESFDGCLIFDECHKAKNFIPGKEQRSTKVALAVSMVQKMLPRARVLYCSATGVSNVKDMAYMEGLGLWGEGLPFRKFENFLESVTRRGLGAAEMLAMEMKSAGVYVSRGLSYRQAEFVTQEVTLSPTQVSMYDSASHVWNELRKSLVIAVSRVGAPNQRAWATFWAAHQRFFKQLCMSLKVPAIVEEIKNALSQNMCVVIGLQTTGESSLESEIEAGQGELDGFVSICKEILQRFVREHFPTTAVTAIATQVVIQDLWCVAAKDMLLEYIQKMELPNSPLDDLIDRLGGPGSVAEMTGRKGRLVRVRGDRVQYELRDSGGSALESLNNQERSAFMSGEKLIAIISDAASTGISLHSDLNGKNRRRRLHITMELPWSADKAVQQLGRSHRANQESGPLYMLITTNVGGERRFAAAVAKRLQTLGALTKGDRRAATGAEFSEFNFDTQYGRSALRQMYNSLQTKQMVGGVSLHNVCSLAGTDTSMTAEQFLSTLRSNLDAMGMEEMKDTDSRDVGRFLNRLLGLKILSQNMMFAYFSECLSAVVSIAKREGRFNEGVTDIQAQSITMVGEPTEVFTDYKLSHVPTVHTHVVVDRGVSWETAVQVYEQHLSDHGASESSTASRGQSGFYCSRREQYHRHLYILALQKENSTHLFNIIRPNTGRSFFEETKADLLSKYLKVSPDKAEKGWKSQYEMTKTHCIHGSQCKNKPNCLVGSRLTHIHLLSGGILPLLSLLESTLARHAHTMTLSKEVCSLKVVRMRLDDGRRLIGVRYPLPLISEIATLLSSFKHGKQEEHAKASTVAIPTSAKDIVIEPQAPINKKSQAKALTPPVSLKNFFHVQPKPSESVDSERTDKQIDEKTTLEQHRSLVRVKPSGKAKPVQMKLLDSFTSVPTTAATAVPSMSKAPSPVEKSSKRKRKLPGEASTHGSLTKLLKQASRLQTSVCPLCSAEIEDASNSGVNLHIDKCLAGPSS